MAAPVPMDTSAPGDTRRPLQVSAEDFDLEAYISSYTGHTKVARLLFIAEHNEGLEIECLRLAAEELKTTKNTSKFKEIAGRLAARGIQVDVSWCDETDKKAAQTLEKLDVDLNSYKTNLIKESIRMGYNDLGDFHYDRGNLSDAFKCYLRARDYCTTSKHILKMCISVIKVSIELGNYSMVTNYVNKATNTPDWSDAVTTAKLKCAAGLAHLESGSFKLAARSFLECSFDLSNNFSEVISQQDVAVYGGLCALAAYDRGEMKRRVIDNQQFKQFLELNPEVRECINDFYESRYASCLNYLQKMKNNLLFDMHLHGHVEALYQEIRKKALIQYFSPFLSVDMNRMAASFNSTVAEIEKEISRLIFDNQIQARIDSHNKILYARYVEQRSVTFQKAITVGREYQTNTKALLLRANMLRAEFALRPPRAEFERERERDRDRDRERERDRMMGLGQRG